MSALTPRSPVLELRDISPPNIPADTSKPGCCNVAKVQRGVAGAFAAIALIASGVVSYGAFTSVTVFTGALAAGAFTAAATWLVLPLAAGAFLALGIGLIVVAAKVKDYTNQEEMNNYRAKADKMDFKQLMNYFGPKALVNFVYNPNHLTFGQDKPLNSDNLSEKLTEYVNNNPDYKGFDGIHQFCKDFDVKLLVKTDKNPNGIIEQNPFLELFMVDMTSVAHS